MMGTTTKWREIADCDEGSYGHPGQRWIQIRCQVYRHASKARYRAVCAIRWGSNQGGYDGLEEHGRHHDHEYRADNLDDLARAAIDGEGEDEEYGRWMTAAIRNAIAEAEDAEDVE